MARTRKPEEHRAKRDDIIEATLGLIMAKGYERMTVADIIQALGISSGAFYHYFGSKPGVLDALVERIREQSEPPLRLVVDDPELTAIEKLQGFLDVLDAMRIERRGLVIDLLRVWYSDDNAVVRTRVETATLAWRGALVGEIVSQGLAEGSFTPADPAQSGAIVVTLLQHMGDAHAGAMLAFGWSDDGEAELAETIATIHAAHMEAIERVLGMTSGALRRTDAAAVATWARALNKTRSG